MASANEVDNDPHSRSRPPALALKVATGQGCAAWADEVGVGLVKPLRPVLVHCAETDDRRMRHAEEKWASGCLGNERRSRADKEWRGGGRRSTWSQLVTRRALSAGVRRASCARQKRLAGDTGAGCAALEGVARDNSSSSVRREQRAGCGSHDRYAERSKIGP